MEQWTSVGGSLGHLECLPQYRIGQCSCKDLPNPDMSLLTVRHNLSNQLSADIRLTYTYTCAYTTQHQHDVVEIECNAANVT